MVRACLLFFLCCVAQLTRAEESVPGTEWVGKFESTDVETRQIGERQLKKMGGKAVPALKGALARTKDPDFKARLEEMLDWCDNTGEPVNGIAVKISTQKNTFNSGDHALLRVQFINLAEKPQVVRTGMICGLPFKQLRDGTPDEKAKAAKIFFERYYDAGWNGRKIEVQLGIAKPMVPLVTTADGEERKLNYKCLDGSAYTSRRPRLRTS